MQICVLINFETTQDLNKKIENLFRNYTKDFTGFDRPSSTGKAENLAKDGVHR